MVFISNLITAVGVTGLAIAVAVTVRPIIICVIANTLDCLVPTTAIFAITILVDCVAYLVGSARPRAVGS